MPVRIRLQRFGRKKAPFYRLVAADSRSQRDGSFLERLAHYNPLTDPAEVVIHEEKTLKWLKRGAQPSDTVKNLLANAGIWEKFMNEKMGVPSSTSEEAEVAPSVDESANAEETETEEEQEETAPEAPSEDVEESS